MTPSKFGEIRIPRVKKGRSIPEKIVAKKDKGAPDRTITRPPRPDRGGGPHGPGRGRPQPDPGFENDLPGEPIVPDRDDELGGDVIVPPPD